MSFQLHCRIGKEADRFGGAERAGMHSAADSVVFVAWTRLTLFVRGRGQLGRIPVTWIDGHGARIDINSLSLDMHPRSPYYAKPPDFDELANNFPSLRPLCRSYT